MRYLGNKTRISKDLLPILTEHLNGKNWYIEPFVGACGMMQAVNYNKRLGIDFNPYIIALMDSLKYIEIIPEKCLFAGYEINEHLYNEIKNNKNKYTESIVGLVGFGTSFGGKFFNGYARGGLTSKGEQRNHAQETLRNLIKLKPLVEDVIFFNGSYEELYIDSGHVIYCDPPYEGTTKYSNEFDHQKFWNWVRVKSKDNYVYVSEYNAPADFKCVWQKEHKTGIHHGFKEHSARVEKLFIYDK